MGEFTDKVFEIVRRIPKGKVSTYGQVARLMGSPRSARYVGFALRRNPDPAANIADDEFGDEPTFEQLQAIENAEAIPCHRVLFSDGRLCHGFAFGGPEIQRTLLEAEGITFKDNDHVDLSVHLWDGRMDQLQNEEGLPIAPPADFDWNAELGED